MDLKLNSVEQQAMNSLGLQGVVRTHKKYLSLFDNESGVYNLYIFLPQQYIYTIPG